MDDDLQATLARFERRRANADRLYDRVDIMREQADAIERRLALPVHDPEAGDPDLLRPELERLRREADALTRDADGIQARLHQPPSQDLTDRVEAWARDRRSQPTRDEFER